MNKNMAFGFGLAALVALGAGCFRNTVSEIELEIPAMKTDACAQAVRGGLERLGISKEGAVFEVRFDVEAGKAWVTYDNVRLGRRNIEVAVRHAGFAVNDLPADEEVRAKLPAECRGNE
ncbi:MAG TPA: hypothetical protein DCM68_04350 [Verrucomicrobia bacterium]|nr:hypothetical protein [Verrucomicrobiota bacterium]